MNYLILAAGRGSRMGNLVFKKENRAGFLEDLGRCASVIANAGFSLASEAASLGKRWM